MSGDSEIIATRLWLLFHASIHLGLPADFDRSFNFFAKLCVQKRSPESNDADKVHVVLRRNTA